MTTLSDARRLAESEIFASTPEWRGALKMALAEVDRRDHRAMPDRRQNLPALPGKAIVARAAGDRRINLRTHGERRLKPGPRPASGFDTRERRGGNDRRK